MKLTAEPVPKFFRLGFQTRAEQEGPTSDSQQGKGSKILVPSKISQHTPEKPGGKLHKLDRVELCCLIGDSLKKTPFLYSPKYKMEWCWHLAPHKGEAAPEDLAIRQLWCNERKANFPAEEFLPLPTKARIPSGTFLPHPSGWDLLILNQDREDEELGILQQQGRTSPLVRFQVRVCINNSLTRHIFYPFFLLPFFCQLLSLIKAPQHGFPPESIQWYLEVFWQANY